MRHDVDLLRDMLRAAYELEDVVAGLDAETVALVDVVRSAAMYKLIVIGEAAARVSPELRRQFDEVPWQAIISFRNRATHGYFSIDWSIVFQIATHDVPELREQVQRILGQVTGG